MTARPAVKTSALLLAMWLPAMPVQAADVFPVRPIRLVSPFAPGGGNDLVSRTLAAALSKNTGQSVVVVGNLTHFTARYGVIANVAGVFTGNLTDAGGVSAGVAIPGKQHLAIRPDAAAGQDEGPPEATKIGRAHV